MRMTRCVVAALAFLPIVCSIALAGQRPVRTPAQMAAIDQCSRDFFESRRAQEPRPTPDWVIEMHERFIDHLTKRAERANQSGIWLYEEHDPKRANERYAMVLARELKKAAGGDLTKLPGYTPERHKEAVAFWQSWQNSKTGRFYNPRQHDPQNPKDPNGFCNEKYVIGLLGVLGAEPLYPHSTASDGAANAGTINPKALMAQTDGRHAYSWFGKMVSESMSAIDNGQTDLIPHVEKAVSVVMKKQNPKTGLWWPHEKKGLNSYTATATNLKLLGRLSSYLGTEGIPLERMADTLITETPKGTFMQPNRCIPRNVAELLAIAIDHTDYRREELFRAMEQLLDQYGKSHVPTRWADHYGIGVLCGYLNCQDCPIDNPMAGGSPHYRGALWSYKIIVDEDGNARIVKKKPEELPWNMPKYANLQAATGK